MDDVGPDGDAAAGPRLEAEPAVDRAEAGVVVPAVLDVLQLRGAADEEPSHLRRVRGGDGPPGVDVESVTTGSRGEERVAVTLHAVAGPLVNTNNLD